VLARTTIGRVDGLVRGVGLVLFGVSLTWLLTVVLGRVVSRRGFAFWVWDRSGSIGRVLVVVGFGLSAVGLTQPGLGAAASSMIFLGALLGMAGIWLILPGP
jgi:hypothetical protein